MKITTPDITLDELANLCSSRLNHVFIRYLNETPALELKTAMEYTLLNSGKHLRPMLIYATGLIFDAPLENLDIPAACVELIHTYSLIHDDLPCMDNSDMRRGKPTCHKVYNEGLAVLAGDALHTLAMQILSSHPAPLKAEKRLQMIKILSKACGPYGMAAGQALDITIMNDDTLSLDLLIEIYRLKTGALFSACIELGRLSSNDDNPLNQNALLQFSHLIGLAFQIQDDILDIEMPTAVLGKTQGLDGKNKKITYPKQVGLQAAKDKVQFLYQEAIESINYLGHQARLLRELTSQLLQRNR
ncbi:MAG: polyprenyl synthetase family protein [Gammaproteobacteria bacterium]|nr:polyprenyl synthetase family protein [Gammaproteobacteria bacterium]